MSDEKRALTRHSAPPSEADYEAILDAVMETGRGRWFLHEFAQRNRHSETRGVLSAIQRIEGLLRAQGGETADDLSHPSAEQIGAAIARAQELLRGGDDANTAFDGVIQSLEAAQGRIRAASLGLQDASHALREEGGHYRICKDLDRQIADVNAGGAQLDDTAGDVRILVALLNEIERQIGEPAGADREPAASQPSVPALDADAAMSASTLQADVVAEPQARLADVDLTESEPVQAEAVEIEIIENTEITENELREMEPAASELASSPAIAPDAEAVVTRQMGNAPEPDAHHEPVLPGDPIAGPADFLLEPLPDDEWTESVVARAPEPVVTRKPGPNPIDEKPAAHLRLDSFDPLAPIRALSDEEKIALFS